MNYGSAKESSSVSESSGSDVILDSGSSSSSGSSGSTGSSQSQAFNSDSSNNGNGGTGGSSSGLGSSSQSSGIDISYNVLAHVVVAYADGWTEGYMMEASANSGSYVRLNGDTAGGLSCIWYPLGPAETGVHMAQIEGNYDDTGSFTFRWLESAAYLLSINRYLKVTNTGTNDILVNGSLVMPSAFVVLELNEEYSPWTQVEDIVTVSLP